MATEWYYQVDGRDVGPLSPSRLRQLAHDGVLSHETAVRRGCDETWTTAKHVQGLFSEAARTLIAVKSTTQAGGGAADEGEVVRWLDADSGVIQMEPIPKHCEARESHTVAPDTKLLGDGPKMSEGWYQQVMGEAIGPFSIQQLRAKVASGQLEKDTPIRNGTQGDWVSAWRLKGLFDIPVAVTAASGASSQKSVDTDSLPRVPTSERTKEDPPQEAPAIEHKTFPPKFSARLLLFLIAALVAIAATGITTLVAIQVFPIWKQWQLQKETRKIDAGKEFVREKVKDYVRSRYGAGCDECTIEEFKRLTGESFSASGKCSWCNGLAGSFHAIVDYERGEWRSDDSISFFDNSEARKIEADAAKAQAVLDKLSKVLERMKDENQKRIKELERELGIE